MSSEKRTTLASTMRHSEDREEGEESEDREEGEESEGIEVRRQRRRSPGVSVLSSLSIPEGCLHATLRKKERRVVGSQDSRYA